MEEIKYLNSQRAYCVTNVSDIFLEVQFSIDWPFHLNLISPVWSGKTTTSVCVYYSSGICVRLWLLCSAKVWCSIIDIARHVFNFSIEGSESRLYGWIVRYSTSEWKVRDQRRRNKKKLWRGWCQHFHYFQQSLYLTSSLNSIAYYHFDRWYSKY